MARMVATCLTKYSASFMKIRVQPRKGTQRYFGDMVVKVGNNLIVHALFFSMESWLALDGLRERRGSRSDILLRV